jgi:hypothetical protein
MSAPNDDVLPEHVRAEVEAIREQEGLNQDEPQAAEPEEVAPVQLSRRAQKEQERQAELAAAREEAKRAAETAEQARREAEQLRAQQQLVNQQMAELAALARMSQQQPQQGPQDDGEDWREKADKHMKKAQAALQAGDLNEYHDRLSKAMELRMKAQVRPMIPDPRQFQQPQAPQQSPQLPPWVRVVENEYPDVVTHQQGYNTVAAFVGLARQRGEEVSPDVLRKAYDRARQELGLKARNDAQLEQRRQMLAGGNARAGAGAASAGGKKNGPTVNIKLAKGIDHRAIARRAGMSEQEYAKAYAQMNPQDVDRD